MRIGLIWAQAHGGVIGADGGMPWHVPEDLAHFKQLTLGSPVVMGRRTWESFPDRFRPLPGRRNIVVTRNDAWRADGAERAASVDDALSLAEADGTETVWVIGGGQVFREVMARADVLEVTELDLDVAGDTTAPSTAGWRIAASDPATGWHTSRPAAPTLLSAPAIPYRFLRYERPERPEGPAA